MIEKQFHRIEDFWQEASFLDWTLGNDREAARYWEQWLADNPAQATLLQEARQLLLAIHVKEHPLSNEEIQQHVCNTIQQLPVKTGRGYGWRAAAAVAGIILLAGMGWLFLRQNRPAAGQWTKAANGFAESNNTGTAPVTVTMKDGSGITLLPGARIQYNTDWGTQERRVRMEGTVQFDVKQLADNPFVVMSGDIETTVLGTVFTVESKPEYGKVRVAVQHGKVKVQQSNRQTAGMILLPNQEASYETGSGQLSKGLIAAPLAQVAVKHQEDFMFTDTPVTTVFDKLEKVYAIRILYDTAAIRSCTITANLNKEGFYDKLDLICKAIGLSYHETEGQLMINGKGCLHN
ncbi:DUF4974 domain-containing protein [Chitinophaga sp. Mgbs1]|uniref:DUF4974 domain-containing protein n=1 Tax=Chitinophaga solisilvae TaxID=1233460 RepID=A0A3S1CVP0_9BACT|nr:DUF4974 domain-containing protein [Chitinophaga solisilvae]